MVSCSINYAIKQYNHVSYTKAQSTTSSCLWTWTVNDVFCHGHETDVHDYDFVIASVLDGSRVDLQL